MLDLKPIYLSFHSLARKDFDAIGVPENSYVTSGGAKFWVKEIQFDMVKLTFCCDAPPLPSPPPEAEPETDARFAHPPIP